MVKPKTLTEIAYEDIKQMILEEQIAPGSKLVLGDLASRLEVSASPIREALTKLQHDKLVEYIPRIGWKTPKLSRKTYLKYREVQILLEMELTRLAFPYVTDEVIKSMEELNNKLGDSLDIIPKKDISAGAILKMNDMIHMSLFSCCDNEVMAEMLENVWNLMRYYRITMSVTDYYREIACKGHKQIIEALKKRDFQAVKYAMERHLSEGPICLEEKFNEE